MPQCDHPIQRAKERYGIEITGADLRAIACLIQRNKGTLDRSHPWGPDHVGTTVWFIEYKGTKLRVVISTDFYSVVTFLPYQDKWRGKQKSKVKKRRRKKVWLGGRVRYVERVA